MLSHSRDSTHVSGALEVSEEPEIEAQRLLGFRLPSRRCATRRNPVQGLRDVPNLQASEWGMAGT